MGLLVIVEGPDRAGKDTLIRNLWARAPGNWLHVHNTEPPVRPGTGTLDWCMERFMDQASHLALLREVRMGPHMVVNRFHLSEFVYGTLFRGYADKARRIYEVENYLPLDTVLVTLNAPGAELWARDDKKSRDVKTAQHYEKLHALFELAHDQSLLKHKLLVNTGSLDPDQVYLRVMNFLIDHPAFHEYPARVMRPGGV